MEIIVLGSGTGVPYLRRRAPALAVQAGERLILLDLGSGACRALLRYCLDFSRRVEPPPGLMQLRELSPEGPEEVAWEGLVIKSAPTNHTPGSLAYRLEAEGCSLVYSGDTDESDSLVSLAQAADLVVLEGSNPFTLPG